MSRKMWIYDPQSGGVKIPQKVQPRVRQRILAHAENFYSGKYNRINVRFRGQFCYIDAYKEPHVEKNFNSDLYGESLEEHIERLRNIPIHLCRLRFFGHEDRWSMAFYIYSREEYEPCIFNNNSWHGTPEEAFDTSSVSLNE